MPECRRRRFLSFLRTTCHVSGTYARRWRSAGWREATRSSARVSSSTPTSGDTWLVSGSSSSSKHRISTLIAAEPDPDIAPRPDPDPAPAPGRGLRPLASEVISDAGGDGASQRMRRVEISVSIDGMRSLFDGRLESDGTASLLAAVSTARVAFNVNKKILVEVNTSIFLIIIYK